ncbi:class I SAM-dependent methyltransferase [Roseovarius aestuarii]|nr:class I SAM-dependent methyltransferase [Roseovarius aestuarii]
MHSDFFRAYLEQTAVDWLNGLDSEPQSILEVGCGQGEFLAVLAEKTNATLQGFDPAFRLQDATSERVVADYLPEEPTAQFDLVMNRMTLEHIARPLDFVVNLRRWLAPGGTLITQVPNAERIIADQHVCELFYEHVNYFTKTSLVHLLERAGFKSNRVEITYDGQSLTVYSRLDPSKKPVTHSTVSGLENNLGASLARFSTDWNRILNDRLAKGREIWLWGTGSRATTFLAFACEHASVTGAVDINPMREGSYVLGTACRTFLPKALKGRQNLSIVVMNPIYKDEISKSLSALSVEAELLLVSDLQPQ